jgi:hypothetical protein
MAASKEIEPPPLANSRPIAEYRQLFCQDVAEYFEPTLQASRMQASNKTAILTE